MQIVNGQPSEEGLPIVSHQPARGGVYVNEGATVRVDDEYGIGEFLEERPILLLEISWRRPPKDCSVNSTESTVCTPLTRA